MSPSDKQAASQALALGTDGRMIASWTWPDGPEPEIQVAMRPPGGQVEPPQTVSTPAVASCCSQVAMDSQGNAIVMWIAAGTFQWATRPTGAAAFGDIHTVILPAGEQGSQFALAMSPAGDPAALVTTSVAGMQPHSRVRALTRSSAGDFQVSPVLDEAENDSSHLHSIGPLQLDVDAAGGFYATWTRSVVHTSAPLGSTSAVKAAFRPAGGGFGAAEDVATAEENTADIAPDVRVGPAGAGVDAAGALSVAYLRTITSVSPYQSEILVRSRPPGGGNVPGSSFNAGTEPVTPLTPNGPVDLAFDVNAGGTGVVVFRSSPTPTAAVSACVRPPGGTCGTKQPLATGEVFAPVAAIGSSGAAVAAWRRGLGAAEGSFLPAGGAFGPVQPLGAGTQVLVPAQAIAVDPLGDAVIAVDTYAPPNRTMTAVVNDSVPPSIGGLSIPPSGEPGKPLAFGAAVTDVWSPFTSSWDFGDGSSAPGPSANHAYAGKGTFTASLTAIDSEGNAAAAQSGPVQVKRVPPRVLSFGMSHRLFAVGAKPTALSGARRTPRGTVFRFRLSERARVQIKIQRKRGRKWKTAGTLKRKATTRRKRVPFSGRLRRKALRPGRYRAVLVAVDADRNRSRPRTLKFKVVRR